MKVNIAEETKTNKITVKNRQGEANLFIIALEDVLKPLN